MSKTIMGRPKVAPELKKIAVTVSLSQWVKDWLDANPSAPGHLIETALIERYKLTAPKKPPR